MEHSIVAPFLLMKLYCKKFLFVPYVMNKRLRHLECFSGTAFVKLACNLFIFSFYRLLVNVFPFRFSNVLNLPESSTLLLSATRLHGKQDKPVGIKHVNHGKRK